MLRTLLLLQIFTVFLTGTKLVSGIENNFGPFEVVGMAMLVAVLADRRTTLRQLLSHPISQLLAISTLVAIISLLRYKGGLFYMGVLQTLIVAFMFLFVTALYILMLRYQVSPQQLLRLVVYSALVIGPWVLFAGIASVGDIQEAGPFRNRAHMANYMLTAFWLVLIYNFWPGISKKERWISYLALASTLYPIAAAGRRSVYLSLIIGLVGVAFAFLMAHRGRRRSALVNSLVIFTFVGLLYAVGPRWLPQLEFFKTRVGGIGQRLDMVADSSDAGDDNFFAAQREGILRAFQENPLLGIGWGGFTKSEYSPTGHEVHSTPLRFLAELGAVGLGLYVAFMATLLIGSLRIFTLLRSGPYRMPAVVLSIALWSMSISYAYNRHVTERTFWLLLVF